MLKLTKPRLRRSNVMLDSFGSCVTDAAKDFSRTPEMSFSEMPSEPGMFFEEVKGTITFKQLQSFANTHGRRKFDKQVDMVNSDVQLINFTPLSVSNLPDEKLTIHSKPVELERVFSIFNFPDKMKSILSKAMFSGFQIHFLPLVKGTPSGASPKPATRKKAHANLTFNSEGLVSRPSPINSEEILNFEDGDSSQNLKVWVPSPWM